MNLTFPIEVSSCGSVAQRQDTTTRLRDCVTNALRKQTVGNWYFPSMNSPKSMFVCLSFPLQHSLRFIVQMS